MSLNYQKYQFYIQLVLNFMSTRFGQISSIIGLFGKQLIHLCFNYSLEYYLLVYLTYLTEHLFIAFFKLRYFFMQEIQNQE